jgi:hypothetical protein
MTTINDLPFECLEIIAMYDTIRYRAMLMVSKFALGTIKVGKIDQNARYRKIFTKRIDCYFDKCVYYFLCGKFHREEGKPAVKRRNGEHEWWIHGVCIRAVKMTIGTLPLFCLQQIAMSSVPSYQAMLTVRAFALSTLDDNIKYRDHFSVKSRDVTYRNMWYTYYTLNGPYHRERDLPAVEWDHGSKQYYQYGRPHRDNGPAIITYKDGRIIEELYYIRGKYIEWNYPT